MSKILKSEKASSQTKVIVASMLGNTLEYYDFTLFVFLSPMLSPLFFPANDPVVSIIAGLGTYALGYFMRPLGAIIFGYIGDTYGRKRALTTAIMMMALPTCIMGLLPTYEKIGILAPLSLIACRLFQGLCTGGEYNGAAIFTVENVKKNIAGFAGAIITSSSALGGLLGSTIAMIVSFSCMPSWAWRCAFIAGGIIALVGFYIRQSLEDSFISHYVYEKRKSQPPLLKVLKNHPSAVFCTMGIAAFSGIMYNISFSYISIFLTTFQKWPLSESLWVMNWGTLCYILLAPLVGHMADRWGDRLILKIGVLATILGSYPALYLITHSQSFGIILTGQLLLAVMAILFQAPMNIYMSKLFEPSVRYSGLAFGYSIGIALFGGTTAMIATALVKLLDNPLAPLIYLMMGAGLGLFAVYKSKPIIS